MSQEPKRRHSIGRKGKRRAGIKLTTTHSAVCKNCKSLYLPHTICANCGFYNGSQVVAAKAKSQAKVE